MKILVALDGSPLSELALKAVAPLLRQPGNEAVLLRVVGDADIRQTYATGPSLRAPAPLPTAFVPSEPPPRAAEDRGQAIERVNAQAAEYLTTTARSVLEGIPVRVAVEWSDKEADGIAQAAAREQADLIAIGTHGRSGILRSALGSVADGVVRQSKVPVIVVRDGMTV